MVRGLSEGESFTCQGDLAEACPIQLWCPPEYQCLPVVDDMIRKHDWIENLLLKISFSSYIISLLSSTCRSFLKSRFGTKTTELLLFTIYDDLQSIKVTLGTREKGMWFWQTILKENCPTTPQGYNCIFCKIDPAEGRVKKK